MPKYCSIYGCNSSSETNSDLSFFHYPKEGKLLKAWICRIRRENFVPSSTSYVCSRHFLETDFSAAKADTPATFRRKRLNKTAIPSLNIRGKEEEIKLRSSRVSRGEITRNTFEQTESVESSSDILLENSDEESASGPICLQPSCTPGPSQINELVRKAEQMDKSLFKFNNLTDVEIKQYTGLEKKTFETVIGVVERFSPLNYWSGKPVTSICKEDQLLIFFMRLKLDLPYFDLARRYTVSQTTIQNIVMTFMHALHEIFFEGMMESLPSQEKNMCSLPESFGDLANCRVIIDCTELRIEAPRSDLQASAAAFSNYKHYLTAKYLIGISPNGAITFISNGFPGSTSDKIVTQQSQILTHLKAGDLILADKGFLIHDLLPKNIFLNLPAFLSGKTQFTKEEAIFSRKVAGCRIHVERAIQRLKTYKILDYVNTPLRPFIDKIVQVCAVLVNLQSPIIANIFHNYNKSVLFQTEEQ